MSGYKFKKKIIPQAKEILKSWDKKNPIHDTSLTSKTTVKVFAATKGPSQCIKSGFGCTKYCKAYRESVPIPDFSHSLKV